MKCDDNILHPFNARFQAKVEINKGCKFSCQEIFSKSVYLRLFSNS